MEETYNTLTEMEQRFKIPAATWYRWRVLGEGPKAIKIGRHLRYPESGVQEWIRSLEERADWPKAAHG